MTFVAKVSRAAEASPRGPGEAKALALFVGPYLVEEDGELLEFVVRERLVEG